MTEMNQPWQSGQRRSESGRSELLRSLGTELAYHNTYLCPVCRHGQITALCMMDAFACDFCRHIFTANLAAQTLRVEDSVQPMVWRWNGRRWQSANQGDVDLTITVWVLSVTLALLPSLLVWLPSHIFPPAAGSRGHWVPGLWLGLTFAIHGMMALWLLVEHYQLPGYVMVRLRLQELRRRSADRRSTDQ